MAGKGAGFPASADYLRIVADRRAWMDGAQVNLFTRTVYASGGAFGLGTISGFPCHGDVSSRFGATDMAEHAEGHNGDDIAAPEGTPVLAPCDLVITDVFSLAITSTNPLYAQIKQWFGNSVWATFTDQNGGRWRTMFAHLRDAPSVYEGQSVSSGTLLGYVGSTGLSTGPHLHWTLGPYENRWLARGSGNVSALDYCGSNASTIDERISDLDKAVARLKEALNG